MRIAMMTLPMPETTAPIRSCDVQVTEIGANTQLLRSRTWDRLKFEAEYARQRGTTANSYLICADQRLLIDPPGGSFTQLYLQTLREQLDLTQLDYLLLSHVNANRMATLKELVAQAPQAMLLCSRPAANALKAAFPDWAEKIRTVRGEETLDLGQGHHLQFMFVPTPTWPDGLCTFDPATRILFTDKFFGAHICEDMPFDENWRQLDDDRRYYFDCLHAPQSKQVETALEKLLACNAQCYAPAHGPVVRYSLSRISYDYRQWCQQQEQQELRVALLYASAYGNTAVLSSAIAQGLIQSEVAVESINCEQADPTEITRALELCDGFIIGSPTLGGHAPAQIQTALGLVLSAARRTKLAGVFGSYGWSGEAVDLIEGKLQDANYRFGFDSIRVRFSPTDETLEQCTGAGVEFAQALKKSKKLRTPHQSLTDAQADRTEQAVGRIIGSLCVVTTAWNNTHRGFLTSWVSQASFNPPGLIVAVGEAQRAGLMIQPGDRFVLNLLKEGRNLRRHFSTSADGDALTQLKTHPAQNGCLILDEALSYLECTVQNRMEAGDRWLVYATIDQGEVLDDEGVTAIHYRKAASQ
jgi:flavorubredoxin/flavin reductase (DIM6/NTAB) family NADH-FMN oxidoreductase RutF